MAQEQIFMLGRVMCYSCHRPSRWCVCRKIPKVTNQTDILILQHPREFRHPLGTAKLLALSLQQITLQVCWQLQASMALQAKATQGGYAVLYPHAKACLLHRSLPPASTHPSTHQHADSLSRNSQGPSHPSFPWPGLIVLDGTWPQARALYRHNPWLQDLPHVAIQPDGIDRYRIRKEPAPLCTSTVEAVVFALRHLEPHTPHLEGLLQHFVQMIEQQIDSYAQPHRRCARGLVHRKVKARLPKGWRQSEAHHVLLCTSLPQRLGGALDWARLTCLAWRRLDGQIWLWSGQPHLGQSHFMQAWQQFCPKQATLLVWTPRNLQPLGPSSAAPGPRDLTWRGGGADGAWPYYVLKSIVRNATRLRQFNLPDFLAQQPKVAVPQLATIPEDTPCKARLAMLIQLIYRLEQLPPWQPHAPQEQAKSNRAL